MSESIQILVDEAIKRIRDDGVEFDDIQVMRLNSLVNLCCQQHENDRLNNEMEGIR